MEKASQRQVRNQTIRNRLFFVGAILKNDIVGTKRLNFLQEKFSSNENYD